MHEHYWRMRVYNNYFDARVSFFPNAWFYRDAYAIYKENDSRLTEHPEWVLKDPQGNKLYVKWGCDGTTCPQYAADIGNPAFRSNWIAGVKGTLSKGYAGVWIDDVNMYMNVSNGAGANVAPIDPRTGASMTHDNWQRYMADFMQEVSQAFPDTEITHNAIWYVPDGEQVRRQMAAADFIEIEHGCPDGGLTNGTGQFSIRSMLTYAATRNVNFDTYADTYQQLELNLACYFLVNDGGDSVGSYFGAYPDSWWAGYDSYLGAPIGGRYNWNGLIRRDFALGSVLLNEPYEPTKTVELDSQLITMPPRSGRVVVYK